MISSFEAGGGSPELPKRPMVNPLQAHLDSGNQFAVGASGMKMFDVVQLQFGHPVPRRISREEALNLAAWIVALVDPEKKELDRLLEAIRKG